MKLSVQLYSFRNEIAALGTDTVFKAIKAAGFDAVETAGDYGLGAKELKKRLSDAGLTVTGSHLTAPAIYDVDGSIEFVSTLGTKDVILAWLSLTELTNPETVAKLGVAAKEYVRRGYNFMYHNHAHELEGKNLLKVLAEKIPEAGFELDAFWTKVAGLDPVAYASDPAARVKVIHLKELGKGGKDDFNPPIGYGVSDSKNIIAAAKKLGHEYIVLEAEKVAEPYGEYLKISAEFIRSAL